MASLLSRSRLWSLLISVVILVGVTASLRGSEPDSRRKHAMVIVPQADRFTPFAITIHTGDSVQWINMDTDDHTVVSDDFFNSAGHNGTDQLVPGTDSNGGQPGTFTLVFHHRGVFVYYCRFHSHLDDDHQPAAPGPKGGIQSTKDPALCNPAGSDDCDFGTPMMGVITVLPREGDHGDQD